LATQPIFISNKPPAEIQALIDAILGGFNNKNSKMYVSAFSEDAVVIDGISPYLWTGPNAPSRWFSDGEKWVHDFGVESERLVVDKVVHATVGGAHAYVVLSARLLFSLKGGESGNKPGILTFTFAKQGDKWKVASQLGVA